MQKAIMMRWVWIISLVILGACSPPPTNELPTLVRIPSTTPTAPTAVVQSGRELPPTFTPTHTLTPTATLDPSITPSLTPTVTITASATITNTPSVTPTPLPPLTGEDRPLFGLIEIARNATVLPQDYQVPDFGGVNVTLIPQSTPTLEPGIPSPIPALPTSGLPIANACSTQTTGGFLNLYQGNPDIANQLGCPSGTVQTIPAAWQNFENGIMVWLNGEILVFYSVSDTFQSLPDTFVEGSDPETSAETPPDGFFTPIRGFLKIWSGNSAVRNGLGWATSVENGTQARVQNFGNGRMVYVAGRPDILILIGSQTGTWVAFQGTF